MTGLTRRALLAGLGLASLAGVPRATSAQTGIRLGLALPPGPLGESILRGAQLGLDDANALATLFGKRLELIPEPAATPEAALTLGLRLVRQEGAVALVGGADDGSAEALRDAAEQAGALFFNVGALSDRLRGERCHRWTFHVQASLAMQVGAAGVWLLDERKLSRWALLVSDSPLGRAVEDAAVAFLARRGAVALGRERVPVGTTDWAPVLGRIQGPGPEVVFVGLEPADQLGLIRAYRAAALAAPLTGVATDPAGLLAAEPQEVVGTWPLVWHHELERFSARELNARFRRRFRRPFDGPGWAAWAAVKLVGEAVVRAGASDVPGLLRFLESAPPFDGHKGQALTFREWDHQLRQPLHLAGPRRGPAAGRLGSLEFIADVPRGGDLDLIAPPRGESRCRFGT